MKIFIRILAVIGGITLMMMAAVIVIAIFGWIRTKYIPDNTILEIDFTKEIVEYMPADPSAIMKFQTVLSVRDVVEALEQASTDERIKAVIANVGKTNLGTAQIQEIRNAVIAFRKKGKSAIAFADTFGEAGPGNREYYLATAFDKIYMHPSGDIGLTGLIAETSFVKGTLDKLGIVPRLDHRKEYKNFKNTFTETHYTEPHKESVQKIVDSVFSQIVRDIASARSLSEQKVGSIIDYGVFMGKEALDAGLIDGTNYRHEVFKEIKDKVGKDTNILYLKTYLERAGSPYEKGDSTVALIYGVGGVQRGHSDYNPLTGDMVMGSDTVTAAFRSAIADEEVKAIIFRVDSRGGSYVASDSIWQETVRAKKAGKPVIASMGNVAGSGGYFVAMAADKIVAQPGTITGSIGVLGGKMLTTSFWDKIGITWDEVHKGENADIWTGIKDYSPNQWARFQEWLDRVYNDFTTKVAEGRNMSIEDVLTVAKGRIWTGEDAKSLGLVDELGGFPEAIRLAKTAAGIPEDSKIRLKTFPKKKSILETILEKGEDSSEKEGSKSTARLIKELQPVIRVLKQAGVTGESGVLSMPEFNMQ